MRGTSKGISVLDHRTKASRSSKRGAACANRHSPLSLVHAIFQTAYDNRTYDSCCTARQMHWAKILPSQRHVGPSSRHAFLQMTK